MSNNGFVVDLMHLHDGNDDDDDDGDALAELGTNNREEVSLLEKTTEKQ